MPELGGSAEMRSRLEGVLPTSGSLKENSTQAGAL